MRQKAHLNHDCQQFIAPACLDHLRYDVRIERADTRFSQTAHHHLYRYGAGIHHVAIPIGGGGE
jgi:hypothetical protein